MRAATPPSSRTTEMKRSGVVFSGDDGLAMAETAFDHRVIRPADRVAGEGHAGPRRRNLSLDDHRHAAAEPVGASPARWRRMYSWTRSTASRSPCARTPIKLSYWPAAERAAASSSTGGRAHRERFSEPADYLIGIVEHALGRHRHDHRRRHRAGRSRPGPGKSGRLPAHLVGGSLPELDDHVLTGQAGPCTQADSSSSAGVGEGPRASSRGAGRSRPRCQRALRRPGHRAANRCRGDLP